MDERQEQVQLPEEQPFDENEPELGPAFRSESLEQKFRNMQEQAGGARDREWVFPRKPAPREEVPQPVRTRTQAPMPFNIRQPPDTPRPRPRNIPAPQQPPAPVPPPAPANDHLEQRVNILDAYVTNIDARVTNIDNRIISIDNRVFNIDNSVNVIQQGFETRLQAVEAIVLPTGGRTQPSPLELALSDLRETNQVMQAKLDRLTAKFSEFAESADQNEREAKQAHDSAEHITQKSRRKS